MLLCYTYAWAPNPDQLNQSHWKWEPGIAIFQSLPGGDEAQPRLRILNHSLPFWTITVRAWIVSPLPPNSFAGILTPSTLFGNRVLAEIIKLKWDQPEGSNSVWLVSLCKVHIWRQTPRSAEHHAKRKAERLECCFYKPWNEAPEPRGVLSLSSFQGTLFLLSQSVEM